MSTAHTTTNAPESDYLSRDDHLIFENSRAAIALMRKSFENWISIARGVERARAIADTRGGRHTFQRLLEQQGLSVALGRSWSAQKSTATRLQQILENLPAIVAWRETLTASEQLEWSAPTTIFKRCPVFNPPEPESTEPKPPSPQALLKEANVNLLEEVEQLKAHITDLEAARESDGGKGDAEAWVTKMRNEPFEGRLAMVYRLMKEFGIGLDDIRGCFRKDRSFKPGANKTGLIRTQLALEQAEQVEREVNLKHARKAKK